MVKGGKKRRRRRSLTTIRTRNDGQDCKRSDIKNNNILLDKYRSRDAYRRVVCIKVALMHLMHLMHQYGP